jgi:hypothetical protein
LDFKVDFPNNLEKTIAAFANTLGGLILLGVDSDPTTNMPIWPSQKGMPRDVGLEERVYQKATEAIYPPVMAMSVSPVIENKHLPGNAILVIRVDESKQAPHAVEKGREVYVYERSGNKTDPLKLAHIDRIKYLLDRRTRIEEQRDEIRRAAIQRVKRFSDAFPQPVLWASVLPVYPWRPLCHPSDCFVFLQGIREARHVQRMPNGAIYIHQSVIDQQRYGQATLETVNCDSHGHILVVKSAAHWTASHGPRPESWWRAGIKEFPFAEFWSRFQTMLEDANKFYAKAIRERPGLLSVTIGAKFISDCCLTYFASQGKAKQFIDAEYSDEETFTLDEFHAAVHGKISFYDRLAYAFDVDTLPGQ